MVKKRVSKKVTATILSMSLLTVTPASHILLGEHAKFITGTDLLIDGGCTASYWYGDLQYLKATH